MLIDLLKAAVYILVGYRDAGYGIHWGILCYIKSLNFIELNLSITVLIKFKQLYWKKPEKGEFWQRQHVIQFVFCYSEEFYIIFILLVSTYIRLIWSLPLIE